MDVAKLNQEILGVDLEYKNVYIDAENTRMLLKFGLSITAWASSLFLK
jgi:hypothetical protein